MRYLLGCRSITNPGYKGKHKINSGKNNLKGNGESIKT
jgi:hypothetical protein